MPEIQPQDKKLLDEIKSTVGSSPKLRLEDRFWWASGTVLEDIDDYAKEQQNRREAECISALLKAAGIASIDDIPKEVGGEHTLVFEDVLKFVIDKVHKTSETK